MPRRFFEDSFCRSWEQRRDPFLGEGLVAMSPLWPLLLLPSVLAVCTLPSDFWCDDEAVMKDCTGGTHYC